MNVEKKELADIFKVNVRTIERWQAEGMPTAFAGGNGVSANFETASVIAWYVNRDVEIETERLRKEMETLRAIEESDLKPGTIDYERYRLTKAQADAQELKNMKDEALVIETEFCTYALVRMTNDIAAILNGVPLAVQRRFPDINELHLDFVKAEIARASHIASQTGDKIPVYLEEYLNQPD